jgi:hypothetical protein
LLRARSASRDMDNARNSLRDVRPEHLVAAEWLERSPAPDRLQRETGAMTGDACLAQRILELSFGHSGAPANRLALGPTVKLRLGRSAAAVSCATAGSLLAASGTLRCVASAHGAAAFSPSSGAHVRLSLSLLLVGIPAGFLAPGSGQIAPVLAFARAFRSARLAQSDRDRLPAALNLAALPSASAFQLAVLELMHHPSSAPSPGSTHPAQ